MDKKATMKCSNTLAKKVDLVFAASIPDIRHMLFPSVRRIEKSSEVEEEETDV